MTICVGYFEAEPPDAVGAFTVAGLVSPKTRWRDFDERWPRALRHEGVAAFGGRDFRQGTGEFGAGWANDEPRRGRLIQTLVRVADQHVIRGCSCSLRVEDYEALDQASDVRGTVGGPYAICAAAVIKRIQAWMAVHHPEDLTLFVFEDGEIDHREIRRALRAVGIDRGEPVQVWPRQWTDDRGRRRFLRPFEACDLLMPACFGDLACRLTSRGAYEDLTLDRAHLKNMCETALE
jgi:hypothetical protein